MDFFRNKKALKAFDRFYFDLKIHYLFMKKKKKYD